MRTPGYKPDTCLQETTKVENVLYSAAARRHTEGFKCANMFGSAVFFLEPCNQTETPQWLKTGNVKESGRLTRAARRRFTVAASAKLFRIMSEFLKYYTRWF